MRPFLFPTYLGRSWTVRNDSCRPDADVLSLLGFVLDRTGGLSASGAVLVKDAGVRSRGDYSGSAGSRKLGHSIPAWAGGRVRYYMRVTLPGDDWDGFSVPHVCGHSTPATRLVTDLGWDDYHAHLNALLARGETKLGRWPIFTVRDWQEMFVNLAAHEAAHLIQYDRDRGHSEVWCEEFAISVLNEFRAARPCGDHPHPRGGGGVAGPAPAASTNQPEGAVMATSAPTASEEAKPDPKPGNKNEQKAAPAAPAAKPKAKASAAVADPKGLFDALVGAAREAVGTKTAVTKKQEYVRLDVVLGGKNKTLAYIHHPTKKGVRSLTPNTKGGYDTATVVSEKDIPKAVKAISSRLDRIKATPGDETSRARRASRA